MQHSHVTGEEGTQESLVDGYAHILSRETPRKFNFAAKNKMMLDEWQKQLRRYLLDALGIERIKQREAVPLSPMLIKEERLEDHIRQLWNMTTEPGFILPFYLLKPLDGKTPRPLVITPHGHNKRGMHTYAGIYDTDQERKDSLEGERDIALQAVRAGYIAIAPMMRGFCELRLKEDIVQNANNSDRKLQMRALLFGQTLIGQRVWDMMRIIDFAGERPEIDNSRVAITGNSGGGTVSLFAAACDPRIALAVPGSYFSTFEDSIGSILHCECNYIPGIMQMAEMYDIAGLICPRGFLAVHGKLDQIYPVEATKYAYEKLKEIYHVAGVPERCKLYIGEGGHRFYKAPVWDFVRNVFSKT